MGIGNRLLVVIDADVKGAIRELDKLGDKADKNLKGTDAKIDKFANNALKFGAAVTAGAAVAGVGLYKAAQQASDLNESITKSDVVFGNNANSVVKWAGTLADKFGLSKREALEAAGGFGSMFRTTGLAGGEAAKMSKRMTELAGDMASFNNEDPTDMLDRLRSGLAGEAEPLRRFGVLLSEARVQSFAYANGIAKTGEKLTEAQKVQARYGLILKDTKLQQGDFARTADGAANSQRRLAASWDNLTTSIGQSALPVLEKVTGAAAAAAGGIAGMDEVTGGAVGNIALLGTAGAGAVGGLLLLAGALAKLKVSLADTATAMPKVAAAAKGLGALTILAAGVLEVKDAFDELKATGEGKAKKLTDPLKDITSPEFIGNLSAAQERLNKLSDTYDKMGKGDAGTRRVQAMGEAFQEFFGADVSKGVVARSAEIRKLSDEIQTASGKFQRMSSNTRALRGQLGESLVGSGFINSTTLSTESIQRLADVLDVDLSAKGEKGKRAVQAVRQALIDAGGATDEHAAAVIALSAAEGAGTGASERRKRAVEQETEADKEAKKAIDNKRLALLASFDSHLGAAQAQQSLNETLINSKDPLEREAAALSAVAARAKELGDEYQTQNGKAAGAKEQQDFYRQSLEELGAKYPQLRALLQPYIDKLNEQQIKLQWQLDHPNITTTSRTVVEGEEELDTAIGKIERIALLDGTTANVYVKSHDDSSHGHRSKNWDGSIDFDGDPSNSRWMGGPVKAGHLYTINERGQELFMPASNGRILNARDSAAKLSAVGSSGGGGNTYVINVNSLVPTAATGQLIREHLHKAERAGVTTSSVAG